jgi:hypothetical protein
MICIHDMIINSYAYTVPFNSLHRPNEVCYVCNIILLEIFKCEGVNFVLPRYTIQKRVVDTAVLPTAAIATFLQLHCTHLITTSTLSISPRKTPPEAIWNAMATIVRKIRTIHRGKPCRERTAHSI